MAKTGGGREECAHDSHLTRDRRSQGRAPSPQRSRVRKAPRAIRVWNFEQMRAFAAGGRPEVRAATKRPVDRRRKKPGPERFFSPPDFEALILTPGLTGLRVSGVNFRPAGPSRLAGARSARPPGFAPRAPYPIWVDQFSTGRSGPVFNRP